MFKIIFQSKSKCLLNEWKVLTLLRSEFLKKCHVEVKVKIKARCSLFGISTAAMFLSPYSTTLEKKTKIVQQLIFSKW